MNYYWQSHFIYLHTMKNFSCQSPNMKLLLRGHCTFLQVSWPLLTSFATLDHSPLLLQVGLRHILLARLSWSSEKGSGTNSRLIGKISFTSIFSEQRIQPSMLNSEVLFCVSLFSFAYILYPCRSSHRLLVNLNPWNRS